MHSYPERARRLRRSARIALVGSLLAVELSLAIPTDAAGAEAPQWGAVVADFNRICSELDRARGRLSTGAMTDEEFADRILDLFVQADSLSQLVPRGGWIQGSSNRGGTFALSRALRYLIESLRENYVGIAARNEADRAYQAAVAWRSGIGASDAPAAR
jgi:hypothetical protein